MGLTVRNGVARIWVPSQIRMAPLCSVMKRRLSPHEVIEVGPLTLPNTCSAIDGLPLANGVSVDHCALCALLPARRTPLLGPPLASAESTTVFPLSSSK